MVNVAIPEMPKRVTKAAIEKIKQMRRAYLQKRAVQVESTGEVVPYKAPERGKVEERRREVKAKKDLEREYQKEREEEEEWDYNHTEQEQQDYGWDEYWDETDYDWEPPSAGEVAMDNLRNLFWQFGDDTALELLDILNNAIDVNGKDVVAKNIEQNFSKLEKYAQLYATYKGTTKGNGFITSFKSAIMNRPLALDELQDAEKANDYTDDFSKP